MAEVCDLIPSKRGHPKLVVHGYLLCKDKNRGNLYYWCCEKRKTLNCGGYANTVLVGGQHHLRNKKEHNHAPKAARKDVAVAVESIKRKAHQPTTLEDIDIPLELRTINDEVFLINDSSHNNERILLFTTKKNVKLLKEARYWIMDGTFKTVPRLFYQLYTIHAPVGTGDNAKVLPLVYGLMTSKSEECYNRLFQDLNDFAAENGTELNPQFIITDFEIAAINASKREFSVAASKGCFFHLGQSVWRQIQAAGLSRRYAEDETFSLILRHIPALAFLPPADIPSAFDELKPLIPVEAIAVVQWFENNYVHGKVRRTRANRNPPLFPPDLWSVFDRVSLVIPTTQNRVEAWQRRFRKLVAKSHFGIYTIINEIRKEQMQVQRRTEDIVRGRALSTTCRLYVEREKRITTVFNDRENLTTLDFLRGIAHNIVL